jgi:hypothetical protein
MSSCSQRIKKNFYTFKTFFKSVITDTSILRLLCFSGVKVHSHLPSSETMELTLLLNTGFSGAHAPHPQGHLNAV